METETSRQSLISEINDLCSGHGCSEKIKKVHYAQYVDRRWNPHPSKRFRGWWSTIGAKDTEKRTGLAWLGIDAVRAFNCQKVQDSYAEAKEVGIA